MKYRIEQGGDNEFRPQYLHEVKLQESHFFRKKTETIVSCWRYFNDVQKSGRGFYEILKFETIEEAQKYIDDENKYPIFHKYP